MGIFIPIPNVPAEVTPAWLTQVLGCKISSKNFEVTQNIQAGTGYLSLMLSVSCTVAETKEKLDLVVKLLPRFEMPRQVVESREFDKTEIECYRMVLPMLCEQVPQLHDFICPFFYGSYGDHDNIYGSVLILKNLKPSGYYSLNFGEEQTQGQIAEGINFLAKLHVAGSLVERDQNEILTSIFPYMNINNSSEQSEMLGDLCQEGFINLDKVFEEFGQSDTRTIYHDLSQHIQSLLQMVHVKCSEFPSIIHGDLWSNNFLFNGDPSQHTKVIDWQLLGYKDPTVDIGVYLMSCIPVGMITKESVEYFLKLYFDTFVDLCKEKNADALVKRDWASFSEFFKTYGLAYTLVWLVISLEPLISKNKRKLLKVLQFLYKEMELPQFIFGEIEKMKTDAAAGSE